MKKIQIILIGIYLITNSYAQPFVEIEDTFPDISRSVVDIGDYDNDGDYDIVLSGIGEEDNFYQQKITRIFKNIGNGKFFEQSDINYLIDGICTSTKWCDFDNDNDLDIILSGILENDEVITKIISNEGIYNFNDIFVDTTIISQNVEYKNLELGDIDNDGDIDILAISLYDPTKLYINEGGFNFIESDFEFIYMHGAGAGTIGDFDNDGDYDILLSGNLADDASFNIAHIMYIIDGQGTFEINPLNFGNILVEGIYPADYDNDGDLDFILSGEDEYYSDLLFLFRNDSDLIFTKIDVNIPGFTNGNIAWGDYDNDGDLDLLVTGHNDDSGPISKIYRNDGNDNFIDINALLENLDYGFAKWFDFDNDYDLDIFISGYFDVALYIKSTKLYRNDLNDFQSMNWDTLRENIYESDEFIKITWPKFNEYNDLTYNVALYSLETGEYLNSFMSDLETGYRRILSLGNAGKDTSYILSKPPVGTYNWKVQSINNAYLGSKFLFSDTGFVPIKININLSDTILCDTSEHLIISCKVNITQNAVYNWDFDGAIFNEGTGSGPYKIKWSELGEKNISLFIIDNEYISDTIYKKIVVSQKPVIDIVTDYYICSGNEVILNPSISGGILPYTYNWNNSFYDSSISIIINQNIIMSLVVEDAIGCSESINMNLNVLVNKINQQICMVTVDSKSKKNLIIWERQNNESITHYNIYKETTIGGIYDIIAEVPKELLSIYLDTNSNPSQHADRYKISVVDTCGNESALSDFHQTIYLSISKGLPGTYNLHWTPYIGFNYGTYYIHKGNSPDNLQLIDSIANTYNDYTDTATSVAYYQIAVKKEDACYPTEFKKSEAGPYSQSVSNIEDNLELINEINIFENNNFIKIYPIPAENVLNIEFQDPIIRDVKIELINLLGQVLFEEQYLNIEQNHILKLDLSNIQISDKILILKLTIDNESYFRKIVIN